MFPSPRRVRFDYARLHIQGVVQPCESNRLRRITLLPFVLMTQAPPIIRNAPPSPASLVRLGRCRKPRTWKSATAIVPPDINSYDYSTNPLDCESITEIFQDQLFEIDFALNLPSTNQFLCELMDQPSPEFTTKPLNTSADFSPDFLRTPSFLPSPHQIVKRPPPDYVDLVLLSQNVRSWRSDTRRTNIDVAIDVMQTNGIHAYSIQETWLDGDFEKDINGYHVFHHGLSQQKSSRGSAGVAIILSNDLYRQYVDAGSPPPIHPSDPEHPAHGRFIGLQFLIQVTNNSRGAFKKKRRRSLREKVQLYLTSAYSPVKHHDQVPFNAYLNGIFTGIPPDTLFFQGQDVNAALGIHRDGDDFSSVVGRFGLCKRDKRGAEFLGLLQSHNLRAVTTFFRHRHYHTWMDFGSSATVHQLDHWITNAHRFVRDTKVVDLGVDSDHSAIRLDLRRHPTPLVD